ncbi:DNA-processing protein DprA [Saccharibacillus kuerlensis]|uniref:DNA processing protein DprA n=1 Tax=Saccharibacillus kuerlensis TaxID=459527 RepID=A0ABQ2KQP3_9BACL|nr:DNA-processing protein DprA [Saccharibacillus kuerlensis]GGN90508.1 DNA processing protein DprA [Saccharibacillus kuerlensis]
MTGQRLSEAMWLLALHETKGIGWLSLQTLLKIVSNNGIPYEELFQMKERDWKEYGAESKLAAAAGNLNEDQTWQRIEYLRSQGIEPVTFLDNEYPVLMKETVKPPWVLYTIGRRELLNDFGIAIVGTRAPTTYGRVICERIAGSLAERGVCLTSGMARGIDGVCHREALRRGGATIAVLGAGPDVIYPPEHRQLYREIAEQGLIVSEFPPGTRPSPGLFPLRNRIIAGLSQGVLIVEAAERSGSLITADCALDSGRDVFAVPGPVTSPKSMGTFKLIKNGAKPCASAEDILEEYAHLFIPSPQSIAKKEVHEKLTKEERKIYVILEQGDASIDELQRKTSWEFGLLHSVLLSLIIKSQVKSLSGAVYTWIGEPPH